jgi:hypothetical protein
MFNYEKKLKEKWPMKMIWPLLLIPSNDSWWYHPRMGFL